MTQWGLIRDYMNEKPWRWIWIPCLLFFVILLLVCIVADYMYDYDAAAAAIDEEISRRNLEKLLEAERDLGLLDGWSFTDGLIPCVAHGWRTHGSPIKQSFECV